MINKNIVDFTVLLNKINPKRIHGKIHVDDNFLCFKLLSSNNEGTNHSFIMMVRSNIKPKHKYLGGLGIFIEPFKSNKVPSAKKIVISRSKLDLSKNSNDRNLLLDCLKLSDDKNMFTVSLDKDLEVFEYIKNKKLFAK